MENGLAGLRIVVPVEFQKQQKVIQALQEACMMNSWASPRLLLAHQIPPTWARGGTSR